MVLHNWLRAFMHISFNPHKSPFYKRSWGSDSFGNLLNTMQLLCSRVWNLNHKFFVTKFYFSLTLSCLPDEMATHSSTLAGKSYGWRSLFGYRPKGQEESDTTEQLHFTSLHSIKQIKDIPSMTQHLLQETSCRELLVRVVLHSNIFCHKTPFYPASKWLDQSGHLPMDSE